MKYVVTAQASDYVEVDAENEMEAEEIGKSMLGKPTYWDDYDVEELED